LEELLAVEGNPQDTWWVF